MRRSILWRGKKACSLRQLEGLDFIGFADDIPTRKLVDDRLRAAGVRVRLVNSFDNIETIKNLVEIGPAVSIVPADTVAQEARAGTLVAVPFIATGCVPSSDGAAGQDERDAPGGGAGVFGGDADAGGVRREGRRA